MAMCGDCQIVLNGTNIKPGKDSFGTCCVGFMFFTQDMNNYVLARCNGCMKHGGHLCKVPSLQILLASGRAVASVIQSQTAPALCQTCEDIFNQVSVRKVLCDCGKPFTYRSRAVMSGHSEVSCVNIKSKCGFASKSNSCQIPNLVAALAAIQNPTQSQALFANCYTCAEMYSLMHVANYVCIDCSRYFCSNGNLQGNGHLIAHCSSLCSSGGKRKACDIDVLKIALGGIKNGAVPQGLPPHAIHNQSATMQSVSILPEAKRVIIRCPTGCGETQIDENPGSVVVLGCGCRFTDKSPRTMANLRDRIRVALEGKK